MNKPILNIADVELNPVPLHSPPQVPQPSG